MSHPLPLTWPTLLVFWPVFVLVVPAYVYRAHVEEAALRAGLGAPYARFAASRRRFIPFVY